jgi:hypothetical protein
MITRTQTVLLVLGTLACAVLTGCSTYDAPTLSVASARITQETAAGMVIDFGVDASNTNDFEVPLERVSYTLRLDGQRVFTGTRSAEATVRRLGSQRITLPAAIDLDKYQLPTGDVEYELSGSVVYVTPGEIAELLFDAGVRRPKAKFRHRGTLDFSEGQPVEIPAGP